MKRYNAAADYYKKLFGQRVQKISIDAGFTCPNRDGTKARGGCTYCNNETFKPFYCSPAKSITQQLKEGIDFFSKKYKTQKYLAYFQAYTNTYAPLETLKKYYSEALAVENVVGLVISTRPDCISSEILDYLQELSKKYYIQLEFGVESTNDKTLQLINRAHTYADTVNAVKMTAERKITVGLHLILGLPGEDKQTYIKQARELSKLPFSLLKLHQLQIIKNTVMARDYAINPQKYTIFELDEYLDIVVSFLENLRQDIMVERFTSESPADKLIAPKWGMIKNYEITHKIEKLLEKYDTFQGKQLLNSPLL